MAAQESSAPALRPTQRLISDTDDDVCSLYTMFQKPSMNTTFTQVLCYLQTACNKYDQHDTHTAECCATAVSIASQLSELHKKYESYVAAVSIA